MPRPAPSHARGGGGILRGTGGDTRQKVGPIHEGCRELEHVHPRISAVMKPYWAVFGTGVKVRMLLDQGGKD